MSKKANTPTGPPPTLAPIIEQLSAPDDQRRMDAVVHFFGSQDAISKYGRIVRARVIGKGMSVFVIGITTSEHPELAIKMKGRIKSSERDMADYVARATNQVVTGRMYELHYNLVVDKAQHLKYDIMIGDRVRGETMATIWNKMSRMSLLLGPFKNDITTQLAALILRMRTVQQPFIGRIGHNGHGPPRETRNLYDGGVGGYFGPFTGSDPEAEFDEWAISRLSGLGLGSMAEWRKKLEKDRQTRSSPQCFVLTHADLSWDNIMLDKDNSSKYVITGLIDWDRSAFFPQYAEYAVLSAVSHHDKRWLDILKAAVPQGNCSKDRLTFTRLLKRALDPLAGGK